MNFDNITLAQLIMLVGSAAALVKFIDWVWGRFVSPKLKKDSEIAKMAEKLETIDKKLTNDFVTLEQHGRRIETLEVRMSGQEKDSEELHNSLRVLVVALQAMIKSSLENGNNREGLKNAEEELDKYLRSKV
jgi:hypothetical protein